MAEIRMRGDDDDELAIEDDGTLVKVAFWADEDDWSDTLHLDRQQAAFICDALTRWLETGTVAEDSRVPNPASHECGGDGVCGKPCDACWKGGA